MTEYLYASPSEKAAFAGAPDDATHAIKLDGQKRWAKKNEADEMMVYAVKGNDIVWRTMELHECEEYELVAERTPIQQPTTRRPVEGSELKWEDAPDGAEFKLKNRTNGSLAWGKNESDDYIAVASQHFDGWYSFTINDWEIISRRVPLTIATPTPYKPAPYEPTILTPDNECWGFDSVDPIEGFVIAYHDDWLWFAANGALKPIATRLDKVTFTKPLTPEEKARAKAVSDLGEIIKAHLKTAPVTAFKFFEEDLANTIINAGYRKGENTL